MKSTFDIMSELSESWKDLSNEEKSSIAMSLAGKNHMEVFEATLGNFNSALKANQTALNASGSAMKENSKYMDSVEGKIEGLKSAWSAFSNSMLKSKTVKAVLSGLTKVLQFLTSDIGKATAAATAFGLIWTKVGKRGVKAVKNLALGLADMAAASNAGYTALSGVSSLVTGGLAIAVAGLVVSAGALAKATYDNYKKTRQYTDAVEKLQEANEKRVASVESEKNQADSYIDSIDRLNRIDGKTLKQKEELKKYVEELNKLYPNLGLSYDANSDSIVDNTGKIYDNINALQALIDKSYEAALAQAYQANAEKALEKRISLESKLTDATLELEEAEDAVRKAGETYGIESAEYATAMEVYEVKMGKYQNRLQAVAKAQLEYSRYTNKATMETDAYKDSLKEWQNENGHVAKSITDKIEQGFYEAPVSKEAWEELIAFDNAVQAVEATGKEVSESIYAGIQEGIYEMPQTSGDLSRLITFDTTTSELKAKGVEVSQDFIDGFQSSTPEIQAAWNDVLGAISSSDVDTEVFSNILNDATMSVNEQIQAIYEVINEAREAAGQEPLEVPVEFKVKGKKDVEEATKTQEELEETGDVQRNNTLKTSGASETKEGAEAQEGLGDAPNANKNNTITTSGVGDVEQADAGLLSLFQRPNVSKTNTITTNGLGTLQSANSQQASFQKKKGHTIVNTIKTIISKVFKSDDDAHGTRNFSAYAKGTDDASFGNAIVNEQGFEIIESPSGVMRVANGGKRGPTLVEEGSAIYTHGQSMRMLQKAGMSEGDLLRGKRNEGDVGVYGMRRLEGFAKGLSKKQYNKKVKALREEYEKQLDKLDDKRAAKNWSDEKYYSEVKKLYKKYQKKFKKLANKRKSGVKEKGFSTAELGDYQDIIDEQAMDNIEEAIEGAVGTLADLKSLQDTIENSKNLTDDEKEDLLKDLYARRIEYLEDMLDDEAITTEEFLDEIKSFYEQGMITAKEYYDYVREIRDRDLEAAQDALQERLDAEAEERERQQELADEAAELAEEQEQARIDAEEEAREAAEEAKEAYHDAVISQIDDNMSMFENQKSTYEEMLEIVQKYYDDAIISAEEYYDYLNQLAEAQSSREQTQADRQWNYLSEYISRQIELESEENDLLEAKNDLLSAQNKKVKVYVEGQGFVYQQDNDAVKEAEDNLKSYTSVWQELQDMMSEAETLTSLKNAGLLAGADLVSLVEGTSTSDTATWSNLISMLSANKGAYELAGELGITDPNQIRTTNTINGQTFNISNVSLPNVADANQFINELTNLAVQAIQTSSNRT